MPIEEIDGVEDGPPPKPDMMNHPPHYTTSALGGVEPIDVIEAWQLPFHLGNTVKYIARHEHKGGLEDLKKARWYLDRYIAKLEKEHADETAS